MNIQEMTQNLFKSYRMQYHTPKLTLISIYDNYSQFSYLPVDEFEKSYAKLLRHKCSRPESGPAVVDRSTFLSQFDTFTHGLFRDFSWDNVLIVGGAVLGNTVCYIQLITASVSTSCFFRNWQLK